MAPQLTFLGHATVLLEIGGLRVLTDPVLRPWTTFLRRVSDPVETDLRPDVVVISHLHHDHCDLPTLRRFRPRTRVLAPAGSGQWLRRQGIRDVTELPAGESVRLDDLVVTATRAEHDGFRAPLGPRGAAIGFMFEAGEARVYFAGDTDLFPEMRDLEDVDVALLPVWGWGPNLGPGHLTPHDAARAVRLIEPQVAVPVHWGTLAPFGMSRRLAHHLYDPPREFARAVARMGLATDVLVTQPGERVQLPE